MIESFVSTIVRAAFHGMSDEENARDVAVEVLSRLHAGWPALLQRYRAARAKADGSLRVRLALVFRD
ncbi:MAG: hypothetical protein AAF726_11180 [Planctomycetota bacterium]